MIHKAGLILLIDNGFILGTSRKYDKTKFGLIGGKAEPNETPKEAAIRECFEETDIVVHDCEFIFKREEPSTQFPGDTFESHCFYATKWSGKAISKEKQYGMNIAWLMKNELLVSKAAYPVYNKLMLEAFSLKFPNVKIID